MPSSPEIPNYEFNTVETGIAEFWEKNKTYEKAVAKNKGGPKFYYLDGPPYTSGRIHIGHAWNKALKDMFIRFKRMSGYAISDTPGFDMHGLPIEVEVEKSLGIKSKQEIVEKIGLKKFIDECEKFALFQMTPMINDFKRIGVWMDWNEPYMTLKNSYIEGAWWALKRANENKFLYEGEKAMTWCPRCATALAKHELEYSNVTDESIFVKFPIKGKQNEFLIVWTTTPWTIPYNLAVMANPELEYVKAKVDGEVWILAKALSGAVINAVAGKQFTIIEEMKGSDLEGIRYEHPFKSELKIYDELEKKYPKVHSVVLSKEYVDVSAGSGLVHCAPGCGPEDYEVGRKYKLPPFNEIDENGRFSQKMGKFAGLVAKKDDKFFIEELKNKGALIATAPVEHEYAHCWRCKTPVVYKTTKQWFLAVEKMKKQMLDENRKTKWVPDWAGSRWFDSWLNDLQDWCISRQRFWGIPLPIWKCTKCDNVKLIEGNAELKKLTGKELKNLHRPWIDDVILKCDKCKGEMRRVEDVLDVWLDSGAAPWATLAKKDYEKAVADFILEGKDQIRGWFNSLISLSMVSRKFSSYKSVYMHGFVLDSLGRKMSKSLKNIISPYEVIDKYGADTMRYYMIGAAKPGLDMNYNFEDMKTKFRNLQIIWNLHKFIVDYAVTNELGKPTSKPKLGLEEKYILSKLNSAIKSVTDLFEKHELNEVPLAVENVFLELSRTYVQMIREKSVTGTDAEKEAIFSTMFNVFLDALKLLAPICPYITEQAYQNLRGEFGLKSASVHLLDWPKENTKLIDAELEKSMETAKEIIQSVLFAREKIQLGLRWPARDIIVVTQDKETNKAVEKLADVIKTQTNIKEIIIKEESGFRKKIKADYAKLGPIYGEKTPKLIAHLSTQSPETILNAIEKQGKFSLKVDKEVFEIKKEHLIFVHEIPPHLVEAEFRRGFVYLNKERTKELEAEGFARELTRRIQATRKEAGLQKPDRIDLFIKAGGELQEMLKHWEKQIKEKVGAARLEISSATSENYELTKKDKIKDKEFEIMLSKI